jgi:AraC family transcriptional activator of pobA
LVNVKQNTLLCNVFCENIEFILFKLIQLYLLFMNQCMNLIKIEQKKFSDFDPDNTQPYYYILIFEGEGTFSVDLTSYNYSGKTLLFLSPHQHFQWVSSFENPVYSIQFHGDFYCIEYHKKEVACNGLLFNNIYLYPHFQIEDEVFIEIKDILFKMNREFEQSKLYQDAVLKSYLQLILALSSKEKSMLVGKQKLSQPDFNDLSAFQEFLEEHFIQTREPSFYASLHHLSPSTFSKKIKKQFGKTPSKLIQERVILEAKRQLHLTSKSIKEIAGALNFEDEFYFSRYFKKETGVSPKYFRETVGISVVAKESM